MTGTKPLRDQINRKLAALEAARERCRQERRELRACDAKGRDLAAALGIAQTVARNVQEAAHAKIADIVTHSLAAVFDEPYLFKINFEQKRGRTEASLVFQRGESMVDPMTASGGGVVDVAAFALRLSCLLLSRPPVRRFLILDEPFRFVSSGYRERVARLVESLAAELDCQFLIVSHQTEYEMGKVIGL